MRNDPSRSPKEPPLPHVRPGLLAGGARRRLSAALLTVVAGIPAAGLLVVAWVRYGLTCDESCYDKQNQRYEPGHRWTSYDHSWQWTASFLLAASGFVLTLLAIRSTSKGRLRHGLILLIPGALLYTAWWLWLWGVP